MRRSSINNKKELEERRRNLRSKLTPVELALWGLLRKKQLQGKTFRRQFSIGSYIVDFYCHSEGLVVELDGADHFTPEGMEYDARREKFLVKQGLRVIRIENKKVFDNTSHVLDYIQSYFLNRQV